MEYKLNYRIKTTIEVDYKDLEQFIKAETGQGYNISVGEELVNDFSRSYSKINDVVGNEEEWNKFKTTGKGRFILRTILEGLCSEGKIPPGDYLVKVSW